MNPRSTDRYPATFLAYAAVMLVLPSAFVRPANAAAINLETVIVGDPDNPPALSSYSGDVDYVYQMGKYEVTYSQYAAFLSAVATSDTYNLYNPAMAPGISRTGVNGSYEYLLNSGWQQKPINYVSWGDGARFANWLHNGQPIGPQDNSTTESGSYALNGGLTIGSLASVTRLPGATFVLPTIAEWVKSGFYNPSTEGYYNFATSSNTYPGHVLPDGGNNANVGGIGAVDVGSYLNSPSPYGTFDQAGNLIEWLQDPTSRDTGTTVIQMRHVASSGYWTNDSYYSDRREYGLIFATDPASGWTSEEFPDTGFRIANLAAVPEPASWLLALTGLIAIAAWRQGQLRCRAQRAT